MVPPAAFCHVQRRLNPLVGLLLQQQPPQQQLLLLLGCPLLLQGSLLLTTPQAMRFMLLCTGGFVAQPSTMGIQAKQYGSLPDRVQRMVKQTYKRPVRFRLSPWVRADLQQSMVASITYTHATHMTTQHTQ